MSNIKRCGIVSKTWKGNASVADASWNILAPGSTFDEIKLFCSNASLTFWWQTNGRIRVWVIHLDPDPQNLAIFRKNQLLILLYTVGSFANPLCSFVTLFIKMCSTALFPVEDYSMFHASVQSHEQHDCGGSLQRLCTYLLIIEHVCKWALNMYVNDYITCTQYRTIYEREDLSSVFRTYYLQKCICYIHIMIVGWILFSSKLSIIRL